MNRSTIVAAGGGSMLTSSGRGGGSGGGGGGGGAGGGGRADYARLHRVLKIIALIQGQKGWDAPRLARECGVSQRTIYRDLQMLEGAGIPYFHDPEARCYQIRRDFFMKPVDLTLEESLALIALGEHIGRDEQIPFTRPAAMAVAKLRSQLPDRLRRELDGLEHHLSIRLAAGQSPFGIRDVYETVRQALAERTVLKARYDSISSKSAGPAFKFRPYALFFSQRAWYVVGHHARHDAVRCLKLNRFTELKPTGERYEIPRGFSLKKHLGDAWRMIPGPDTHEVELRFDADFAETVADTHWHETQETQWHEDGTMTFRCRVAGLTEIVWWVLSMGPHCTVVNPPALAQQVAELAQGIVALYPDGH